MQCPQCQADVRLADVSQPCRCGAKLYLEDKWKWPRAIACAALDLLVFCRWYPLDGAFPNHIRWLTGVGIAFLALCIVSYFLIPFTLALAPQDGPVRLDL